MTTGVGAQQGNRWQVGLALLLVVAALGACTRIGRSSGPQRERELVVFAAASLTEAFSELGQAFERAHQSVVVTLNFAGSQQLAQQLANGAPADVFASANDLQMNLAVAAGRIDPTKIRPFAENRLVVVIPVDNPAGITVLSDLARPGVKLVVADRTVPVGQYTAEFLAKATANPAFPSAFGDAVLANVVSYESNVRAVLAKVLLGEADAGIVYTSDITAATGGQVMVLPIPDELNTEAVYPIAPVVGSAQEALAQQFVDYVTGKAGQAVLERYGFYRVE